MNAKVSIAALILSALYACTEGNSNEANHYSMRVDGAYLEADTNYTTYFIWEADSGLGLFGAGGSLVYNSIQVYGVGGSGTYPILSNGFPEAGLRFQQSDSVYYINETHGHGTLHVELYSYSPGTIHRLKGSFEGVAETDAGTQVTITEGKFSYTEP